MGFLLPILPDDPRLGGKARSLAVLASAGLATPDGFVVGDGVFHALCPEGVAIARLDPAALRHLDELRAQLARRPWPAGFLDELGEQVGRLAADRFAVRSSFAAEDVSGRLAAGVYESRVDLAATSVADAVREVLASALGPGAVAYALAHGCDPGAGPFAVLVHGYAAGEAEGSAALADRRNDAVVTVRRGELPPPARAELAMALRELVVGRGPVEIEWVLTGGKMVYLQARPYQPPPPTAPWAGWAELRAGDAPPSAWRWDAAHNPLPLSPAQAGLVELVDGACRIGIRQRVLGGYLFYSKDDRPLPPPIACEDASDYFAALQVRIEPALVTLAAKPDLERALELFISAYEPIFGVLQPALRRAHARLREFLEANVAGGVAHLPVLRASVPSVASERLARLAEVGRASTQAEREAALAAYLARFGDEAAAWDVAEPTYAEAPPRVHGLGHTSAANDDWRKASDAIAGGLPAELRDEWHRVLAVARTAVALGEADDWLFARTQAAARRALLAVARRLTESGLLASPDDVFFLPLALVRCVAAGQTATPDLAAQALAARQRWQEVRRAPPPPPQQSDGPGVRGIGVGGRAIGRVSLHRAGQVAATPADAVLVAATLLPTELPLIHAAALVIETGGPLDHVAAQARERKLPAVVGATGAAAVLRDGDLVLVDGDRGLVVRLRSRSSLRRR